MNISMGQFIQYKWISEGGLCINLSNLVTVVQYIIYAFLPNLLGLDLIRTALTGQ